MIKISRFLIVDDDEINNMLCKFAIEQAVGKVEIKTFCFPEKALDYIATDVTIQGMKLPIVLFLDINMPTLSGWEFLEEFENLKPAIKDIFIIYMLSSSIDERDRERAASNKNVQGFLSKPLNKEMVQGLAIGSE